MDNIKVIKIRRLTAWGNLKAFIDVEVKGIIFHDFRIIQQPNQAAWVSPPQAEWTDKEGQQQFRPLVRFPAGLKEAVSKAVLEAWAKEE